jgi:hypothetical protein
LKLGKILLSNFFGVVVNEKNPSRRSASDSAPTKWQKWIISVPDACFQGAIGFSQWGFESIGAPNMETYVQKELCKKKIVGSY